jgi:uncharacterized damage-inducible protein DinB
VNIDDIQTLYAYNRWANRRLLAAARPVETRDFMRDLTTSHGSLKGTLVHILWGEWIWLRRWLGESPKRLFASEEFPDIASLESRWAEVERDQVSFIAGLTDEQLQATVSYENLQGQRWAYSLAHMMQHVVNHSSYHRGQVVTLLRQLGQIPPATDFLLFFDETASRAA